MPWRVGIDEAGYGPNLGPLVMTAAACRVPDDAATDLWQALAPAVRRRRDRADSDRFIVDDSKLVYSTTRGIGDLETSVIGIQAGIDAPWSTLAALVGQLHPDHALNREPWYQGDTKLPVAADQDQLRRGSCQFRQSCARADITWQQIRSVIVCPPHFNELIDRWGSKGAVLGAGLVQLLQSALALEPAEPVSIVVDKHGGRNRYGALLQEALPEGWVLPRDEGMDSSVYDIRGLDRPVRVEFRPRADGDHFEVALASMISKYVREVLMIEFNQFWQQHVPGLEPTAGYPLDALRFLIAIRPALTRLRIAEDSIWRKR